jgi:hypothetical protein
MYPVETVSPQMKEKKQKHRGEFSTFILKDLLKQRPTTESEKLSEVVK